MGIQSSWTIRTAREHDRRALSALLHSARWLHQHQDWLSPLDLLGSQPYLLAVTRQGIVASIAIPASSPHTSWLRLYAVHPDGDPYQLWRALWAEAVIQAAQVGIAQVAVLGAGGWLSPLLLEVGFRRHNEVIYLEWHGTPEPPPSPVPYTLRRMTSRDLPHVAEVDRLSFDPLWQNSLPALEAAMRVASQAMIIEVDGRPVAYQISTTSIRGGHIARLAVHPEFRRRGYARTLVHDSLRQFASVGFDRVTVNTQIDNAPSQRLYQSMGFTQSDLRFPIYQIQLEPL